MDQIYFRLKPVAPFDLRFTAWALRRRPDNMIDRWNDQSYQRVMVYDGRPMEVEVTQTGTRGKPVLHVTIYVVAIAKRFSGIDQADADSSWDKLKWDDKRISFQSRERILRNHLLS